MSFYKNTFLFLACLLFSLRVDGQWSVIQAGVTDNITAVDYYNSSQIYMTAGNDFIYTTNGGSTWVNAGIPVSVQTGQLWGTLEDVKASGNGNVVTTGFFINNIQHILVTPNNGGIWTDWIYTNASNPGLCWLNSIARRGNKMVAVGEFSKYGYSTDAGNTWSFGTATPSYEMMDVEYFNNDTVFAVGYNRVAKSLDGGASWFSYSVAGSHATLAVSPNYIYIAEYDNKLLKSTNLTGSVYATINLPFSSNGVVYALSDDTLFMSGDSSIFRSTNGGLVWEKLVLPAYRDIRSFDYFNGELIAVGDSGFAIRNPSIATASSLPIPAFEISQPLPYCLGQTISFSNQSGQMPGLTYQWKVDGRVISNQYNASYVCRYGTHTVTLLVTNQYGTNSISQQFTVLGHVVPHHTFRADNKEVCKGNYPTFTVPKSQIGVNYRLRTGYTTHGSPKAGTGGPLSFVSTTSLQANTQFNLLAIGSNFCFTDSLVVYDSVNVKTGAILPACIPNFGNYVQGISSFQLNGISNSSPAGASLYTDYSCQMSTSLFVGRSYAVNITATAPGMFKVCLDLDRDGSPTEVIAVSTVASSTFSSSIVIPESFLLFNTPLRLRVGYETGNNLPSGCGPFANGEYEDYGVIVLPSPVVPVPEFSMNTVRSCNTTINFINETTNVVSYLWDFGDGSTDTVRNPSHVYALPGAYTVTLTAVNPSGNAFLSKMVTVDKPQVPVTPFCTPTSGGGSTSVYIAYVALNGMTNTIGTFPLSEYKDFTCTKQTYLLRDSLYRLYFSTQYPFQGWIDYNNDGYFQHPSESLGSIIANSNQYKDFTVPNWAVLNTALRMRLAVASSTTSFTSSCTINTGQFQDYTVFIDTISRPKPAFTISDSLVCGNEPVQFVNATSWAATSFWDFGDGTTSTVNNPVHVYQLSGDYSVKLITCDNAVLCDSVIKYDRIRVKQTAYDRYVYMCPGQQVTIGSSVYTTAGVYQDTLPSVTGCDSIITLHLSVNSNISHTISAQGPVTFCKGQSVDLVSPPNMSGWQWYRNNVLITGATAPVYTAYLHGVYHCVASDAAYCNVLTSNSIQVTTPCAPEPILRLAQGESDWLIYPNPSNGVFYVEGFTGEISIWDITGRMIYRKENVSTDEIVDLSGNPAGLYSVILKSEQSVRQQQIMLLD